MRVDGDGVEVNDGGGWKRSQFTHSWDGNLMYFSTNFFPFHTHPAKEKGEKIHFFVWLKCSKPAPKI